MTTLNKIVIAGGSGFIGKALIKHYQNSVSEIVVLTRSENKKKGNVSYLHWDGKTQGAWSKSLDGAAFVINLTGKSVNCRYNEKNKKEIFDSRTDATIAIEEAINTATNPPVLWINAASATIYRHAEDRPMDESTGEIGEGFSVEVCKKWEKTFTETNTPLTRKVALRIAIVMGKNDGVVLRLSNLVKIGLGGKQGNGNQYFSWIHEEDLCAIVDWLWEHKKMQGVYNCSAPVPLKNKSLMEKIRKAHRFPFGFPSPTWLLKIGAVLIGTETELIFKSRWVIPEKILKSGFKFKYENFDEAVKTLV
jgi:uncharacterized protein (TIGR01777 family)